MLRNIIIVGPPRSGTSLASDIFARQGYHTGEGLRCGDDYNPFGYYEAQDLIDANVELFQAVGYGHHNTWKFETIGNDQIAGIEALTPRDEHADLLREWQTHQPWMWKDPRFAITLGYWAKLIDWSTTGVVLTCREAEDVYWSFRRKGWCEAGVAAHDAAIVRIRQHAANAQRVVDELGLPHIAIEYGEYHDQPQAVAERIARFAGLDLSSRDLNFHAELDHSTGHSRLAGWLRIILRRLPRKPLKFAARIVPRRVQSWLLPERRFADDAISEATGAASSEAASSETVSLQAYRNSQRETEQDSPSRTPPVVAPEAGRRAA